MHEEFKVKMSPLCQSITKDGQTVQIDIYEDGAGGWLLEVVDEYSNSTVWDDPFKTDQEALTEVLEEIEKEGFASLVGSKTESSH